MNISHWKDKDSLKTGLNSASITLLLQCWKTSVWICKNRLYQINAEICEGTCFICFGDCIVNSLYKISLRFNIREYIDCKQRKVGLLHRRSTQKAESPHRLLTTKGRSSTPTVNNERKQSSTSAANNGSFFSYSDFSSMKDASMKLWSLIMEKQAYKNTFHISTKVDESPS